MLTFEEAGAVLDEAADALPQELFNGLNGGINLLPDVMSAGNGLYTFGRYNQGPLGRYIEIFYGSFVAAYADEPDDKIKQRLVRTLHHELTHHVEALAGDRSLEEDDATYLEDRRATENGEPVTVDSVLFVGGADSYLGTIAEELFRRASRDAGEEIECASAALDVSGAAAPESAVQAAAELGMDISDFVPEKVTREMVRAADAVFCMTEEQADELAERYPQFDYRIFAIDDEDINEPFDTARAYRRAAKAVAAAVGRLADELYGEE